MTESRPHVSVCVATYCRPDMLCRLLVALGGLDTGRSSFSYSVLVADNDCERSARPVVLGMSDKYPVPLEYYVEPQRSISLVRNRLVAASRGDAIAFIDDDETPERDWLLCLFNAWKKYQVAGVLGPVRPRFPAEAPSWVERSRLFERREHETGFRMTWPETRTGNVLFDRRIVEGVDPVFKPEFGTGGSDQEFFRRMMEAGHEFVWCSDGIVHEVVGASRWRRRILARRALLRGQNNWRQAQARVQGIAKALIAIPLYSVALPFLVIVSHHLFVRYLVKLCDHLGRVLASLGIHLIPTRDM